MLYIRQSDGELSLWEEEDVKTLLKSAELATIESGTWEYLSITAIVTYLHRDKLPGDHICATALASANPQASAVNN